MWASYGGSEDAVAIRTNVQKLISAVITDRPVFVGKVRYIDYETERVELPGNALQMITCKQDVFSHEREVRAVIWLLATDDRHPASFPEIPNDLGIAVAVSLADLVESIVVSALAPSWFVTTIEQVVVRYGLAVPVIKSSLGTVPDWATSIDSAQS